MKGSNFHKTVENVFNRIVYYEVKTQNNQCCESI
jgi:hypothetical protein